MKTHPRFVAWAAVVGVAAGAAVIVHRIGIGTLELPARRWMALSIGVLISAIGFLVFQRAARRRARLEAIRALLPRYPGRRRSWGAITEGGGVVDPFLGDSESGELSDRVPIGRAEIHAATRALLVSLEEEMRGEVGWKRRQGRPACRRARLRAAGRLKSKRRRSPPRPSAIPS